MTKHTHARLVTLAILTLAAQAGAQPDPAMPRFGKGDDLLFPQDYREWIFLSAGYGMTYGPAAPEAGAPPLFSNVFVRPEPYRQFLRSGRWPQGSQFVLEIRGASSESAINEEGKFQSALLRREVSVKDSERFEGGWGYYDFGPGDTRAPLLPYTASCYACHAANTAVDNTFVQFYPTLIEAAREHGTFVERQFP